MPDADTDTLPAHHHRYQHAMNQTMAYQAGCTFWTDTAAAYIASKPAGQELYCTADQSFGTARCTSDFVSRGLCYKDFLTWGSNVLVPASYPSGHCYNSASDNSEAPSDSCSCACQVLQSGTNDAARAPLDLAESPHVAGLCLLAPPRTLILSSVY